MISERTKNLIGWVGFSAVLILNAVFLTSMAFRHFNFFDMGSILDAAWRLYCGQRPYVDFIYVMGPIHLYFYLMAFKIFGFGKMGVLAYLLFIPSLLVTLMFVTLRKYLPVWVTLIVLLLTTVSFQWNIAHPWYDQTSHLWGVAAVLILVNFFMKSSGRIPWGIGFFCGIMTVLSTMSKTNIGVAYGVCFFVILLCCAGREKSLLGYLAGLLCATAFVFIFLIRYPRPYFEQILTHTQAVAGNRFSAMLNLKAWSVNYYWVCPAVLLAFVNRRLWKAKELFLVFICLTFVAIYSVHTGNIIKPANIYLWGVQMGLAFLVLFYPNFRGPDKRLPKSILWGTGVLACWSGILIALAVMSGMQLKVWTYTKRQPFGDYTLQSGPLKGWKTEAWAGKPADALVDYINEFVPKTDSLLNLTDMYIIYALTGRDSYRGIPVMFMEKNMPAPGRQTNLVREYILTHPPQWIIVQIGTFIDEIRFLDLDKEFREHYVAVFRSGWYFLLKRK
jgi:hypothetical protein